MNVCVDACIRRVSIPVVDFVSPKDNVCIRSMWIRECIPMQCVSSDSFYRAAPNNKVKIRVDVRDIEFVDWENRKPVCLRAFFFFAKHAYTRVFARREKEKRERRENSREGTNRNRERRRKSMPDDIVVPTTKHDRNKVQSKKDFIFHSDRLLMLLQKRIHCARSFVSKRSDIFFWFIMISLFRQNIDKCVFGFSLLPFADFAL